MKGRILSDCKRLIIGLLILCGFSSSSLAFQKNLSGNINQPKSHVITKGVDRVTVDNVSGFFAGDTILLIQMQGVKILTANGSYGTMQDKFGEPGMWEFLIIQTVNAGPNEIIFRNFISKNFDPEGSVQIVRVPYYNSATVTGKLFCDPWSPSAKSGGVLALIIGRTLKLKADIDVSGLGFTGGKDTIGDGICWSTNIPLYGKDSYAQNFTNAGYKGEGIAIHNSAGALLFPLFSKGLGHNFTGGGGGNARYSGGGGGSNRGFGGTGGFEACASALPGGNGGVKADHASLINRIYLGGGGGASTTSLTGISGGGGKGGGIVIIVADTIIGNGGNILSNGENGGNVVSGITGAGGGGAAGSIALSLNSYGTDTTKFYLKVKGGKGGDNSTALFGEGGGGGGGLLWINTDVTSQVKPQMDGGESGVSLAISASPGTIGEKRLGFKANLNGFLFNSIRSLVTGDQIDSICSNVIPKKITGTKPVGGTSPYFYLWEKSYDQISWTPLANDTDPTNYTPLVLETDTVYFRRSITDSSTPIALIDVSKPVKIIVQPFIKNNIIGTSDTICFAQNPLPFTSKGILADGNGKYSYKWQVSLDSNVFNLPVNNYYLEGYTPPPALEFTSWYRRTVTSGRCIDSSAIVKIKVIDTISNNKILNSPPDICYGMTFVNLSATSTPALTGGDNSYRFKWESSINGSTWVTATGVSNLPGYNPDELSPSFPGLEYFRRVVFSGIHNVCMNNSTPVLLKNFPVITGNNISPLVQTIGHDSIPDPLIGISPGNGNGFYSFLWQSKTRTIPWSSAAVPNNGQNYSPTALTDTTWYRRVVNSSACSDSGNVIVVNVHKPIVNNNIAFASGAVEDTVCNGSAPAILKGALPAGGSAIPGDYVFQWYYSFNNITWSPVTVAGNGQDYSPGALIQPVYYFRREVGSPAGSPTSVYKSNVIKITVLPLISNYNINSSQIICYGTQPAVLQGISLSGGDNIYRFKWQDSTNIAGWSDIAGVTTPTYQPPNLTAEAKYKRIVYSGNHNSCSATSNIIGIGINPLPTGTITTISDTVVCEGSGVPLKIHLTNPGSTWKVIYTENGATKTINKIVAQDTTLILKPTTTNPSAIFNYALNYIQDNKGCLATSLTGTRKLTIYKIPASVAGNDAVVCGPKYTLTATPSVGTGKWYYPAGVVDTTINAPSVTVSVDSATAAWGLENKYRFTWREDNWNCFDTNSVFITFYKRTSIADAGLDTTLYSLDKIYTLRAAKPLVGTGAWSVISGGGTIAKDSIVSNLTAGLNEFKWTITNGACKSEDFVIISVNELLIPQGFSPNGDAFNEEFIIQGLDTAYNEATLRILNSAGTEVFYTSSAKGNTWSNWKGENGNGILPEGTYYYLLTIKSKRNSTVLTTSGFIILKRYNSQ